MVFLCWSRPSPKEQKACINKELEVGSPRYEPMEELSIPLEVNSRPGFVHVSYTYFSYCISRSGGFNYDSKYRGVSTNSISCLQEDRKLWEDGFMINHARILVGSGLKTYEKGKTALQSWRHFGFDWTFVDPKTPIKSGEKFCVCVKEFLPWVMLPLQVVYVNENRGTKKAIASFSFGSGTLEGHLLAGEEWFSIELDENNQVWYEILSFSKPAHFLSFVGSPYVQFRQKYFANQSTNAVLKHMSNS